MRLLPAILILTVILHSTVARCKRPRPSPVMGALQTILSPANAERTMQLLKLATQQTLGNTVGNCNPTLRPQLPVVYSPPISSFPEPCNSPINVQIPIPNLMPNSNTLVLQNSIPTQIPGPTSLQTPNAIQVQMPNPTSYQISTQMPVVSSAPLQVPVQLPSPLLQVPCQVSQLPTPLAPIPEIILERSPCPCDREIIYPFADVSNYVYNPPVVTSIPEVIEPIPLTSAQDIYTCPLPSPAALFTLPAASAGCSCALDSTTGTRSHYLRKIPIPPPTL